MANAPVALAASSVHSGQNPPEQPQPQQQPQQPTATEVTVVMPAQAQQQDEQPQQPEAQSADAQLDNQGSEASHGPSPDVPWTARSDDSKGNSKKKMAHIPESSSSKALKESKTANHINAFISRESSKTNAGPQTSLGKIVESTNFNIVATCLIIANAVYIGLETDLNPEGKLGAVWLGLDVTFATLFSVELILRIKGTGGMKFIKDPWNAFDTILVFMAILDATINTVLMAGAGSDGNDSLGVFSAVRILRALRLARILRLLRFFKELWLLVSGVINSLRTLAWAWLLIVLIIYIFGIFTTRTLGQTYGCALKDRERLLMEEDVDDSSRFLEECDPEMDVYFGTVPLSMFTFFQIITTEGWADIARRSMDKIGVMWIVFILFISITTFAIMNVVIAVIVENTLDQAALQRNDVMKKLDRDRSSALQRIYEVFQMSDKNGDQLVSRDEFMAALKEPEVMRNFHSVEIDLRGAEGLFDILDYDDSGSLDMTEFIEGCMRARGGAKAKDVLALQCDLWRTQQGVRVELQALREMMNRRFQRINEEFEPLRKYILGDEEPPSQGTN